MLYCRCRFHLGYASVAGQNGCDHGKLDSYLIIALEKERGKEHFLVPDAFMKFTGESGRNQVAFHADFSMLEEGLPPTRLRLHLDDSRQMLVSCQTVEMKRSKPTLRLAPCGRIVSVLEGNTIHVRTISVVDVDGGKMVRVSDSETPMHRLEPWLRTLIAEEKRPKKATSAPVPGKKKPQDAETRRAKHLRAQERAREKGVGLGDKDAGRPSSRR